MRFVLLLLLALPACVLADQESDFRAARDALRAGNASRLDKAAERLKDTPLEPYVTYYQLRLHWGTKATEQIKAFLARNDETPVVDQFRGEWLKYLGEREQWETFAQEYPHLVNIDDELVCYNLQMRQISDEAGALAEARKLWFRGDEMPDSCTPLFTEAMKQGIISEADVWQRMRLALESGNTTLAKELIKKLPKAAGFSGGGVEHGGKQSRGVIWTRPSSKMPAKGDAWRPCSPCKSWPSNRRRWPTRAGSISPTISPKKSSATFSAGRDTPRRRRMTNVRCSGFRWRAMRR